MKNTKRLGIWMDHSSANLMELTGGDIVSTVLDSAFTHNEKEQSLEKGEHLMHNKEQHEQTTFYKKLGETIRNYDEVILFGPTTAKNELANLLKDDHHFEKIKVEVKNADKMNEYEMHLFVEEYFQNSI